MNQYRANRVLNERIEEIRELLNQGVINAEQCVELTAEAQDRHQSAVYRAYAAAGGHILYGEDEMTYIMENGEQVRGDHRELVERLIANGTIRDFYAEI